MPEDAEPEYSDWQSFERIFSNGKLKNATSKKQYLVGGCSALLDVNQ